MRNECFSTTLLGAIMPRSIKILLLFVLACCFSSLHAADSATELSWSSVPLSGMHLRLVSPKSNSESHDLYFGDGTLAISSCSEGWCTGPVTVWKIENNRLKTGDLPDEGDTLVELTAKKIVLRKPDGKRYVYSIVAQNRQPFANPLDAVSFYVIPTDDVTEQAAGTIARALTKDTGVWIKSTVWAPSDVSEPFSGTNQYPAEDYFPVGERVGRTLRDTSPNTYFIVLTNRDINSKTRNFRFQYSMHSPTVNTSVLSIARLLYNVDGSNAPGGVVTERIKKMLMRIVGEMRLGWKRTSDPKSLMYAPVMSIDDIDRMSLSYTMQPHKTGK